jgi:hypothetical protein
MSCDLASLHFLIKLSSRVTFVCTCVSFLPLHSYSLYWYLHLSSVSLLTVPICLHILETVSRQPSREHLVEPFNFLFFDITAASVFVTEGTALLGFL